MSDTWDVAIIGTGPAGVSATFPLLARGLRVVMIDGGDLVGPAPPQANYLDARRNDPEQWRWMIGEDFQALRGYGQSSPKFRVPTLENVFKGFLEENRIHVENFEAVGSIVTGGLSNAWGCGVARFDDAELSEFPFTGLDLAPSYERVAKRIGISGKDDDDLASFYGIDTWAQSAVPLDGLHATLLRRYRTRFAYVKHFGFRLGRARMAVLTEDAMERHKCELLGTCLWGCARGSMYSARMDLQQLRHQPGIGWCSDFIAARIQKEVTGWAVHGYDRVSRSGITVRARTVLVAAGCLATNRLVRDVLDLVGQPTHFFSNPAAGFLVWFPHWTGKAPQKGFGSSQLSFTLRSDHANRELFGFLFPTSGLPVSEFVERLPFARRYGVDVLKYMLPSSIVGNLFLPGDYSRNFLALSEDRSLRIVGHLDTTADSILDESHRSLAQAFRRLGGFLPPGAFASALPGSDVHYAGGLPMRERPERGECNSLGEVAGVNRLFVVDSACFPSLPTKPLTLTIMANADRIATEIARRWT
jgi:choline dehydrogenase-like flavoprotein